MRAGDRRPGEGSRVRQDKRPPSGGGYLIVCTSLFRGGLEARRIWSATFCFFYTD